jgi:hypothetical protein
MIKVCLFLSILIAGSFVQAASPCKDIPGTQNHTPLVSKNGAVCFIEQPVLDDATGQPVDGAKEIALYFVPDGRKPIMVEGRGLSSDGAPGTIADAFMLDVDQDGQNDVVLIHVLEPNHPEPNSSGKFYSVEVFNQTASTLRRNERASEWFGYGYSWQSDGNKIIHEFPNQTQKEIRLAVASPFASLIVRDGVIPATVKHKSWLYDDSMVQTRTKKYLITGDEVTVSTVTSAWCEVNYTGGKKPLKMWLKCSDLEANAAK